MTLQRRRGRRVLLSDFTPKTLKKERNIFLTHRHMRTKHDTATSQKRSQAAQSDSVQIKLGADYSFFICYLGFISPHMTCSDQQQLTNNSQQQKLFNDSESL